MAEIEELIKQDLSVASRCYFHGTTTLGGTDACRPELQEDGSIILRSLNLSHVAYRVTEAEYRELRKHPQRKVGLWDFVREDDQDADHIASATRYPQSAGRRIGDLERAIAAKDAEIERLREALTAARASIRNARGAVESNQVVDKDVHGTLSRAIRMIDAALNQGASDGQ